MKWHRVNGKIVPIKKYASPGRPAKGAVPAIVGWCVQGELVEKQAEIVQARQWKGRFILATNELDAEALGAIRKIIRVKLYYFSDCA
ncbi:hypothetical protein MNBD_CHLOROFLEXI01-593 [hydrothermal vent metagenome]|uniref:Uncharacterized protein n=1 Tax=hydrothermal vent metagenome TaxID=652676 RepID=A0A3B0V641_9ZZZZ